MCELHNRIFSRVVHNFYRLAGIGQRFFAQHVGNKFEKDVRRNLLGIAKEIDVMLRAMFLIFRFFMRLMPKS